jgi:hypothetical protein
MISQIEACVECDTPTCKESIWVSDYIYPNPKTGRYPPCEEAIKALLPDRDWVVSGSLIFCSEKCRDAFYELQSTLR